MNHPIKSILRSCAFRRNTKRLAFLLLVGLAIAVSPQIRAQEAGQRKLDTYLAIFINGYGSDPLPKDNVQFEKLLEAISGEGHFNAILCSYTSEREQLCKKHGVRMVVDLLDTPHVSKDVEGCEKLLKSLRGNPTVAAYHVWSDRFGAQGEARARDIDNVQKWDSTHPTFTGTYKSEGMEFLVKSDIISFYDFHWKRAPHKNFQNLINGWKTAQAYDGRLGRYCSSDPDQPGLSNYNRMLSTQTTSIACGLRASMWHIGSHFMDMNSLTLNAYGKDLARVNEWLKPMRSEIAKLGLPFAIYSTRWTKDLKNDPVESPDGKGVMPPGLENHAFPSDYSIQPSAGEFVMGISKYADTKHEAAFFANHNAYAEQEVVLKLSRTGKVKIFDQKSGRYKDAEMKDGAIRFKLEPAGAAILKFESAGS
ncbi:MAG: hypothetical protein V4727_08560 [Verrucomicrobiota bacterium]